MTPTPDQIGNYRLVRLLGQGGMGQVYEGRHVLLEQRVAIKMLRRDAADSDQPERRQRFLREAALLARVHHPGVVRLFDYGYLPDGTPYLIMELLEGETLRLRLGRLGRLPVREAVQLGAELADALCHVHALHAVHRDVKPENIMLARLTPDTDEVARLLDFGLVHDDGVELPADLTRLHTHSDAAMGTTLYMAPEQVRGEGAIDGQADVYALGLVLYEALSGALPCPRDPVRAVAFHASAAIAPPLPADSARPSIVDELVTRMLQKDRSARPDMATVLAALRQGRQRMDGGDSVSMPAWQSKGLPIRPSTRQPVRRRILVVVAMGFLAFIIGSLGAYALAERNWVLDMAGQSITQRDRELARRPRTAAMRRRELLDLIKILRTVSWLDRRAARYLAEAYHRLSTVAMDEGDLPEARRRQDDAARLLLSRPARGDDEEYAHLWTAFYDWEGGLAKQEGYLEGARAAYERALAQARARLERAPANASAKRDLTITLAGGAGRGFLASGTHGRGAQGVYGGAGAS